MPERDYVHGDFQEIHIKELHVAYMAFSSSWGNCAIETGRNWLKTLSHRSPMAIVTRLQNEDRQQDLMCDGPRHHVQPLFHDPPPTKKDARYQIDYDLSRRFQLQHLVQGRMSDPDEVLPTDPPLWGSSSNGTLAYPSGENIASVYLGEEVSIDTKSSKCSYIGTQIA